MSGRIVVGGHFSADEWLAEIMYRPVFKWVGQPQGTDDVSLEREMASLAKGGGAFFYAKLPTRNIAQCTVFERAGFGVVDTGVTFSWAGELQEKLADIDIGLAGAANHEAVAEIAERCFRWSRFHLDPHIPLELANLIKRRWIENYCQRRRGESLYVAQIDGNVAGFLAVLKSSRGNQLVAAIDLIGVDQAYQGCGVGSALIRRFIADWKGHVDELIVGTQIANIQSMRFYERNGFRVTDSSYVFHAHYLNGNTRK